MKLYMHPVSMTSRPVRLFLAESGVKADEQVVDLMTGEHHKPPFVAINPNRLVPVLEDGDLTLTESSAILKYVADKIESPAYPRDLKKRARVNEMMDWFNTNFYRDYAYNFIYPQVFAHHRRPTDEIQNGTIQWGKSRSETWLQILNDNILGTKQRYLCGDEITIADYFGVGLITLGELIRCDFGRYPNVARWIGRMKELKSWPAVNEVFYGFQGQLKDQQFVAI